MNTGIPSAVRNPLGSATGGGATGVQSRCCRGDATQAMNKSVHPTIVVTLLVLLALTLAGVFLTGRPAGGDAARVAAKSRANSPITQVDEQPLKTAQRLAPQARPAAEQEYAQAALRVADHEVDLAFADALRQASARPVAAASAATPEVRELNNRLKELRVRAKSEADDLERVKQSMAKAGAGKKEIYQQQLELAQAKLELTQDEIDDAHQDIMRAGGHPQGALQRL